MKYIIKEETDTQRTYVEEKTGNEVITKMIYTDMTGRKWWGFTDLYQIPYMRKTMAQKVVMLYSTGFIHEDIKAFVDKMKGLVKANDPEKYEKVYSELLQMEKLAAATMDPVQQDLALCTIYVMFDTEQPHIWTEQESRSKLSLWRMDLDAASFFLSWVISRTAAYGQVLPKVSETALRIQNSGKDEKPKELIELFKMLNE